MLCLEKEIIGDDSFFKSKPRRPKRSIFLSMSFKLILFFCVFSTINSAICPDGFFWCNGKLCYNSTMYDSCCGNAGINTTKSECCYKESSSYYSASCDYPKRCCQYNCFDPITENCCYQGGINKICNKTQTCCKSACCEADQTCCEEKCCDYGYECKGNYFRKCVLKYTFEYFYIPIILNSFGFALIIILILEKCGCKDYDHRLTVKKKDTIANSNDKILSENSYKEVNYNSTHEVKKSELNPAKIYEMIARNNYIFSSKIEFEKFILGLINRTYYRSSIFLYISNSIPLYFLMLVQEKFLFMLPFFFIFALRNLHLYVVLKGKGFIKCTLLHGITTLISITTAIGFFIYIVSSDNFDERFGFRMGSYFILFYSMFPVTSTEIKLINNELYFEAMSSIGGSSKDNYGNHHSSSYKEMLTLKISYPSYLQSEM